MTTLLFDDSSLIFTQSELPLLHVTGDSTIFVSPQDNQIEIISSSEVVILDAVQSFNVVNYDLLYPLDSRTGIEDAAYDSKMYLRKNGGWLELNRTTFPTELDSYLYGQVDTLNSFKDLALGNTAQNKKRFVDVNDLLEMGIIERTGTGLDFLEPGVDIVFTGPRYQEVPPAPINFYTVDGVGNVQLFWESANDAYNNHGVTQVYRGTANTVGSAVLIATVPLSYSYTDSTVIFGITYKYWIRFVSDTGVVGPFNATAPTPGTTSIDPDSLLNTLDGLIGESQLANHLLEPIQLITGLGGLAETTSYLQQALIDEANARADGLIAEANARTTAILLEATDRGTAIDEVFTIIESTELKLAERIEFVTAVFGSGLATAHVWQFNIDNEGWLDDSGTPDVDEGQLIPTFSSNTFITSPALLVDGHEFNEIRMRIIRVGEPIWAGVIYYTTTVDTLFDIERSSTIDEPLFFGNEAIVLWDMETVSDWDMAVITGLQIQLSIVSTAIDYYKIEWINIAKVIPGDSIAAVVDEVSTLATDLAAEAAARNTLAVQLRGEYEDDDLYSVTSGFIHDEREARVTADASIVERTTVLQAGIRDMLDSVNGDLEGALGEWKGLASVVENLKLQAIKDAEQDDELEDQVTVTADKISILEARADSNEGTISTISNIVATNNTVLTQSINTLSSTVVSNNTTALVLITNEQVARVSATEALASQLNITDASITTLDTTLSASIENERTARVNLESAMATEITLVRADFTAADAINTAAISNEQTARVTATEAVATSVVLLTTVVNTNNTTTMAAINAEQTVRSTADSALATSVTNVQAQVNDNYAAIQVNQIALADLNGDLSAQYSIKLGLNSNGKYYATGMAIGIGNTPSGMQSEVAFLANNFHIMHVANGALVKPFRVVGGNTFIETAFIEDATISFAKISDTLQSTNYVADSVGWRVQKNGTAEFQDVKARGDIEAQSLKANTAMVDTLHVNGNAITTQYFSSSGGGTLSAGGSLSGQCPMSITMPSGSTGIIFVGVVTAECNSNLNDATITVTIVKNGSAIYGISFTALSRKTSSFTVNAYEPNPGGTNTYSMGITASVNGIQVWTSSMVAMGGKR